ISKASNRMTALNGKEPTVEELADELDLQAAEVSKAMGMAKTDLSIDARPGEEPDADPLSAFLESTTYPGPEESTMENFLRSDLTRLFEKYLKPREASVLKLYYGLEGEEPHTLEAIGKMFHLSRERIRQTKEAALKKLRDSPHAQLLQCYLN
ncbi:MAG: sigma factor-like helix-turn-helix DNA-binding protein, partial [bacterium]